MSSDNAPDFSYDVLRRVAEYLIEVPSEAASPETLRARLDDLPTAEFHNAGHIRAALVGIFRTVWKQIANQAVILLQQPGDPRDILEEVFSRIFKAFLVDEPVLGKCIVLECHRYNREKIRECFAIPEYRSFLQHIQKYVKDHVEAGDFSTVNPSALVELFLSMQDGMMFAWIMKDDFGYPADFSQDDFDSIARMLVSAIFVPSAEQSRQYYDKVADQYDILYMDGVSVAENNIVGNLLADIIPPGGKVLDLGCGSGLGYELLTRRLATPFEYVGVDISVGMVRAARRKFLGARNAQFITMNMEDLSYFRTATFDVCASLFGSFSHVLNWSPAVAEIRRVLKPGGEIMLMVYSRFSLRNLFQLVTRLSAQRLAEVRPYEIRKTSGSIYADARFYTKGNILRRFNDFTNLEVLGLNCTLELPFIGRRLRRSDMVREAEEYLRREMKLLKGLPNCCHSLVIRGQKPI